MMNKKQIEVILKGNLEIDSLTDSEKEIALKILSDLEGVLVIRATSILKFCLKAIQYSKVITPNHTDQPQESNFSPITGEKLHKTCPNCWVIGNKPYDCGYDKCPGYKLYLLQNITHL